MSSVALGLGTPAQAQPIGGRFPEFAANTGSLRGSFVYPSAARLANGRFVLVMGLRASPLINSGTYFQIYSPQGAPLGSLTRVKPMLMLEDAAPAIAAATGAGFVVVWSYREHFDSPEQILGQRYSAAGIKLGSEFKINSTNPGHIGQHTVVSLADGGFVVVWDAGPNRANSGEIYAQRYNVMGAKVGGEFIVNTTLTKMQGFPSVARLANGGFVVAWNSPGSDGADVHAQRYAADGTKAGAQFKLTRASGEEVAPVIAGLNGGGFVATWTGPSAVVYGRRFDATGLPMGPAFLVGDRNRGLWEPIALSVLDDDRFLIAWSDGAFGEHVYARVFGPTAASDSPEFRVNTTVGTGSSRIHPAAVALSNRNLFVMWEVDTNGTNSRVRLRRLDFPAE